MQAIRCDHDGLKMAEVNDGHLILRTKHHGETHVKVVSLRELYPLEGSDSISNRADSSTLKPRGASYRIQKGPERPRE